jgi:hypothetical protein
LTASLAVRARRTNKWRTHQVAIHFERVDPLNAKETARTNLCHILGVHFLEEEINDELMTLVYEVDAV